MVSFGKNKAHKATTRRRYRYDEPPLADKEIADVLLTQKDEAPLAAALVEPKTNKGDDVIYELRVEQNATADESAEAAILSAQVEKLCSEYAAINQQLEKSLVASNELTQQLEKSKKVVAASYIALAAAGLAILLGAGAILVGVSMQRDVDDLKNSLSSVANQTAAVKKQVILNTQEVDGRITQLNEKVDKIFASDNLDGVLQVTRELRKQVHALASKNLAIMSGHNQSVNEPPKVNKVSLPSLKLETTASLPNQKSTSTTELNPEKKASHDKQAGDNEAATVDADANWALVFGTFKDKSVAKSTANKLKKAELSVEIVPIKLKKHQWYRVVSKSFNNKAEAQNHADDVEKTLGIHAAVLTKSK